MTSPHDDRNSDGTKPLKRYECYSANKLENDKWTVITAKRHRKGFSPKNPTDNNILVKEQFGFREKLSTDTATFAFLNKLTVISNLLTYKTR